MEIEEPDKYYKIRKINSTNHNEDTIYVFCGKEIKQSIDENGINDQIIEDLGIEEFININPIEYIGTTIHPDDNMATVYSLINVNMKIPLPYQYLYFKDSFGQDRGYVSLDETSVEGSLYYNNPDFIGCGHVITDYIGHAYKTKKESKGRVKLINTGDKLIFYQLNPFEVDITMTRANSTPEAFYQNYKGWDHFVNDEDNIIDGNIREPTKDLLIDTVFGGKYGIETICLLDYRVYLQYAQGKGISSFSNFLVETHLKKYWPDMFKNKTYINTYYDNTAPDEINEVVKTDLDILYNQHFILSDSPAVYEYEINQLNEGIDGATQTVFTENGITEVIIHVNYDKIMDDFIDLHKIWDRIKLDESVPFIKIKSKDTPEVLYRFYDNVKKDVDQNTIRKWVTPESKDVANASVHGVSFKIRAYSIENTDKDGNVYTSWKYATTNIYKNGRIELKCAWDEKFNNGKGATIDDVKQVINKLQEVIVKINKISYQIDYKRTQFIASADTNLTGNTQIILMNTLTKFTIGEQINYTELNKFGLLFGHYINVIKSIPPGADPRNPRSLENTFLQVRYKRVDGFTNMSKITRFIHSIYRESPEIKEEAVVAYLKPHFNLDNELATDVVRDYKLKYGNGSDIDRKKEIKKGKKRQMLFNDFVSRTIKQPGVDIYIKGSNYTEYRLLINGVKNPQQLDKIIDFFKSFIIWFKYRNIPDLESSLQALIPSEVVDDDKIKINVIKQNDPDKDQSLGLFKKTKNADNVIILSSDSDASDSSNSDDDKGINNGVDIGSEGSGSESITGEGEGIESGSESGNEEKKGEEDEETKKSSKLKPKQTIVSYDPSNPPRPLDRLKAHDPILFAEKSGNEAYPRKCQATIRQPMVISPELYAEKKQEIDDNIGGIENMLKDPKTPLSKHDALKQDLAKWKYKADVYKNGIEYRGNYYFCATGYDYQDENILTPDEIAVYRDGNKTDIPKHLFIRTTKAEGKYNKARYLEDCSICCFTRDTHGDRANKCESAVTGSTHNKKEPTHASTHHSISYIMSPKRTLTAGRYGQIPSPLYNIFNTTDDIMNAKKMGDQFNGYLRRGAGNFLSAVTEIAMQNHPAIKSIKDLINFITDKKLLTVSKFQSLKQGTLKTVFQESEEDTDESILERFKIFVNNEPENVTEDFIWDYVTGDNVITISGFNLYIFEQYIDTTVLSKDNKKFNFKLKCPIGYEMNELYQPNRSSVVLIKYITGNEKGDVNKTMGTSTYDVVCKVESNGSYIDAERFIQPQDNIMNLLTSMLANCNEQVNEYYKNHAMGQLLQKADKRLLYKNPLETLPTMALKNVIKALKPLTQWKMNFQIIDKYNKVVRLVLDNNVIIPVKPSGRNPNIDIWEENYYDANKQLPNCVETYNTLMEISQKASQLNLKPMYVQVYPKDEQEWYVGFVLQNGLTSEFIPLTRDEYMTAMTSIGVTDIPVEDYRYYQDTYNVDAGIERNNWKLNGPDARTYYVNTRMFEDETYQRLRFEVSKFLQEQPLSDVRQAIIDIIKTDKKEMPIDVKRQELFEIIKSLIEEVSSSYRPPELPLVLSNYSQPNIRQYCKTIESENIIDDPHCTVDESGLPKVYVSENNLMDQRKNNIRQYTSLIVEELLKNTLKRKEILDDIIDTTVRKDVIEHQLGVTIVKNAKAKPVHAEINKIYNPINTYKTKLLKSYDMISGVKNSVTVSDMDECQNTWDKPPVVWRPYLGGNVHVLVHSNTTMCIFKGLINAITQLPEFTNESIENLKDNIATFITKLKFDNIDTEGTLINSDGSKSGNITDISEESEGNKSVDLNPSEKLIQTVRKPWQIYYDYIKYTFTGTKFPSINDETNFYKYLTSPSYQLTVADLMIISHIYNVRIIILKKLSLDKGDKIISKLNLFPTITTTVDCDNFMLILNVNYENYRMIANTEYSPHKYIFNRADLSKKLMELIDVKTAQSAEIEREFAEATGVASPDTFENKLYSLLIPVSPVTKEFNVVDKDNDDIIHTAVNRKVNPVTTDILAVQSLNPHLTKDQKYSASQYVGVVPSVNPLSPLPATISNVINLDTNTSVPSNRRQLTTAHVPVFTSSIASSVPTSNVSLKLRKPTTKVTSIVKTEQ